MVTRLAKALQLAGVLHFQDVALCRIPGQVHPPGRVVLWGLRTGAAGQTAGLCVRQLGSQTLLFAPQRVIVRQGSQ